MNYKRIIFTLLLVLLTSCTIKKTNQFPIKNDNISLADKLGLEPPEWTNTTPQTEPYGTAENTLQQDGQTSVIVNFKIWCTAVKTSCPPEDEQVIKDSIISSIKFLESKFGPPVFRGEINVISTSDPVTNGKMRWNSEATKVRQVVINSLNFYHEPQWKTVVHEFFHALYESNDFLSKNPDFVAEGLAVYAENSFAHRNNPHHFIRSKLLEKLKDLGYLENKEKYSINAPFNMYDLKTNDILYSLSGYFFAYQDHILTHEKIRNILENPTKWTSLAKFAFDNELITPKIITWKIANKEEQNQRK